MIITHSLPRLAPSTIRRPRLERWLATHTATPVRLLIAPPGSGKTTLLLKYLPESAIAAGYCALPPQCGPADLYRAIATALALPRPANSYDDLIALLRAVRDRTEL